MWLPQVQEGTCSYETLRNGVTEGQLIRKLRIHGMDTQPPAKIELLHEDSDRRVIYILLPYPPSSSLPSQTRKFFRPTPR